MSRYTTSYILIHQKAFSNYYLYKINFIIWLLIAESKTVRLNFKQKLSHLLGPMCLSVASNKFWLSMLFQNLVRLSQIWKISLPDYAHVNKVSKKLEKMTINVIQHDDRLWYLRLFYNGTFSIASKNDLDDQNLLLATVHISSVNVN
jgi:hypothetical protein